MEFKAEAGKKIIEEFNKADTVAKKAGIAVAGVALSPVVVGATIVENVSAVAKDQIKKAKMPLYWEEYNSKNDSQNLPALVMIEDDAKYKNDMDYKGAIGKTYRINDLEVLSLWDRTVPESGLTFLPIECNDTVYYADPHNKNQYIKVEDLFNEIQNQKIAELMDIAYCLGCKSYKIELVDSSNEKTFNSVKVNEKAKAVVVNVNNEIDVMTSAEKKSRLKIMASGKFNTKRTAKEPELVWFKDDKYVVNLIKQIIDCDGQVESHDLVIEGSKYAVMSVNVAAKIDTAVNKICSKVNLNIKDKVEKEQSSKLVLHMEF